MERKVTTGREIQATLVPDIRPYLPEAIKWIHFLFGGKMLHEVEPIYEKDGSVKQRMHRILTITANQSINPLVVKGKTKPVALDKSYIYTVSRV